KSLQGIRLLRAYGNEQTMLAAGRNRSSKLGSVFSNLILWNNPLSNSAAWKIYYRVTGKTFESIALGRGVTADHQGVINRLDPDRTDEIPITWDMPVSMTENLSLSSSRMDGTLDPDAALGYLEWTMVFKNTGGVQQEAVSQIALPPGGVVSRLT